MSKIEQWCQYSNKRVTKKKMELEKWNLNVSPLELSMTKCIIVCAPISYYAKEYSMPLAVAIIDAGHKLVKMSCRWSKSPWLMGHGIGMALRVWVSKQVRLAKSVTSANDALIVSFSLLLQFLKTYRDENAQKAKQCLQSQFRYDRQWLDTSWNQDTPNYAWISQNECAERGWSQFRYQMTRGRVDQWQAGNLVHASSRLYLIVEELAFLEARRREVWRAVCRRHSTGKTFSTFSYPITRNQTRQTDRASLVMATLWASSMDWRDPVRLVKEIHRPHARTLVSWVHRANRQVKHAQVLSCAMSWQQYCVVSWFESCGRMIS